MAAGVGPNGYTTKTADEVVADINADVLANMDATLDLSPTEPLGRFIGIIANNFAKLYELGDQIYHMLDRDAAEGLSLDNIGVIVGNPREEAAYTRVPCTVNLDGGITLGSGAQAAIDGRPDLVFEIETPVTNSGGSPANIAAVFVAVDPGPIVAAGGTLIDIVTPVSGWNSITNTDGVVGQDIESDPDYRQRQDDELFVSGSSSLDALRAKILLVDGVIECRIRENFYEYAHDPDGSGALPLKSFEVVLWNGTSPPAGIDDAVAQVIFDHKPAGMRPYSSLGVDSGTATDDLGVEHTIEFSKATAFDTYLYLTIQSDADTYVGDTAVKAYVVEKANARQKVGDDIVALYYHGAPLQLAGVIDVPTFAVGESLTSNQNNIALSMFYIAVFDTSRIVITHV